MNIYLPTETQMRLMNVNRTDITNLHSILKRLINTKKAFIFNLTNFDLTDFVQFIKTSQTLKLIRHIQYHLLVETLRELVETILLQPRFPCQPSLLLQL